MFYALATHPEVQKKAQVRFPLTKGLQAEEIDRVIGPVRLPNFEDRISLPYVEAIYRELMRWKPPAPIGIPHTCSEDDFYQGYFIPKGRTICLGQSDEC